MPAVPPLIVPESLNLISGCRIFPLRSSTRGEFPVPEAILRSSLEAISFPLPSHKITLAFNSKSSETVPSGFTEILKFPAESLILEKVGAVILKGIPLFSGITDSMPVSIIV